MGGDGEVYTEVGEDKKIMEGVMNCPKSKMEERKNIVGIL
jgi:methionine synthase II (cobalamin-independent)